MGVEIENSLEAAIGVALPPTSLMRARTIGQIATLITGHVAGIAPAAATPASGSMPVAQPATSTVEVDLDALSTEEIGRLLGDDGEPVLKATPNV
jgi:hypothetical protein